MYRLVILKLVLLLITITSFGQHALLHPEIKIDTGYTIHSAFKKHKKYHPSISIAKVTPKTQIKEHREVVYRTYANNREMHLDIFEPAVSKNKKRPCMIIVHGGGWITGDKSLLEPFAIALADKGYVTVCVEYRFSQEALYPAAVVDINSAIRWITKNAKKYNIDPSEISIMGSSAGGQLATLVGVTALSDLYVDKDFLPKEKIKIHSIVDLDGVIAFIHPLSKEGGKLGKPGASTKWFGVHYKEDSTKWIEASALTHVDKNTPPTLFVASSFPRFNAGREDMMSLLKDYNIHSEKHVFEDAPHSFWLFDPWFDPTLNYIINFLEKLD